MITPARYSKLDSYKLTITSDQQWDLNKFKTIWLANMAKYEAVAHDTDIPPQLIAALHMRESDCDFTTYLLQGDKLGTRTWADGDSNNGTSLSPDLEGTVLYGLDQWHEAAVYSLQQEQPKQTELQLKSDTTYLPSLCAFAEMWNGTGYYNANLPDPYVLAGTSGYIKGKYIGDHHFDPNAVDEQIGVLPLLWQAFKLSPPILAKTGLKS